jgi:hypothetical protein
VAFQRRKPAPIGTKAPPLFQLALSAVPEEERTGPIVTDWDGDPVCYRVYYGMYRDVADEAGVPGGVWSRGTGTAADLRRARRAPPIDDIADHLQKSDTEGARRDYMVGNVETTWRVARKRIASRPKLTSGSA